MKYTLICVYFMLLFLFTLFIIYITQQNRAFHLYSIFTMKKIFQFFCAGVFLVLDLICFLFEVLYDLVFESTAFFFNAIQELYNLITFKKSNPNPINPYPAKPNPVVTRIFLSIVQIVTLFIVFCWVVYFYPIFGDTFEWIANLGAKILMYPLIVVCGWLLYIPQQRVFRDPLTRFFFRLGWFKYYEDAVYCAKLVSFTVIALLFFGAWLLNR